METEILKWVTFVGYSSICVLIGMIIGEIRADRSYKFLTEAHRNLSVEAIKNTAQNCFKAGYTAGYNRSESGEVTIDVRRQSVN